MTLARPAFEGRMLSAIEAGRIPVLVGGCGTGRTFLLRRLRERLGEAGCQYINVERSATTPERLLRTVVQASPFPAAGVTDHPGSPREAFDALLAFLESARTRSGAPVTFLLDEVLEFRTFENFPGLRQVFPDLIHGLAGSPNRFVLSTRFVTRALRLLRDQAPNLEVVHVTPLTLDELRGVMGGNRGDEEVVQAVHALTNGHAGYAQALTDQMAALDADPIAALAALLLPDAALTRELTYSYELRLHRARGYGALKAILDILAEQEPLTLTEIARRLKRTPGSTKDYLSWLEDVDLVAVRQKRYSIANPVLRLWVRLHCRPEPPGDGTVAEEVQQYALERLPRTTAREPALVGARPEPERKGWGIIEID
jgi:AAA domain